LDNIRHSKNLEYSLKKINSRYIPNYKPTDEIILTCTNRAADFINGRELEKLCTESKTFVGELEGKFNIKEDKLPSPINLTLKTGAQVMFTKNDTHKRWVNGSLGVIEDLSSNCITVRLYQPKMDKIVDVIKENWINYGYIYDSTERKIVSKIMGKYTQYPLMLAWAITIHKSQGKTLPKAVIDFGYKAFAPGQVYVALSRVRSLNDIVLTRPIKDTDIIRDKHISDFYEKIKP